MEISHPTTDPNLVSYHRPELVAQLPGLELALDCWNLLDTGGRGEAKKKYLHQEPAEPRNAYLERLHRSTYTPIYRDSIRAYAGLLSRFQLIDVPGSLEANQKNIDLQGSTVQSFLNQCDERAIRDGGVFVMVDMMPEADATNYLDQQNDGRRPYLIMIERKDVINWSIEYKNGREMVRHATVRQLRSVPNGTGFGTKIEPFYFVLKPNLVERYRLEKTSEFGWLQILEESIPTTLPVVPLVWYGASTTRFAQGDLPMAGLAELSIQHYQMRSDLQELLHKCAMPVPVRKGAQVGPNGQPPQLILGPNTAVDLPADGGAFDFAEPSGRSLERHQAEVEHVETLMDRSGLNFLYGTSMKTATEASLRASQVASQVNTLIRNKLSAFNIIMRLWAVYSGEVSEIGNESGIAINDSLINRPLDPSGIAQLINLYSSNLLSRATVLDELQRGGILDPDLSVEQEQFRIDSEQQERLLKEVEATIFRAEATMTEDTSSDQSELDPGRNNPVQENPNKKRARNQDSANSIQ